MQRTPRTAHILAWLRPQLFTACVRGRGHAPTWQWPQKYRLARNESARSRRVGISSGDDNDHDQDDAKCTVLGRNWVQLETTSMRARAGGTLAGELHSDVGVDHRTA
ncbi:hypothetical protein RB195_006376 [Necator americanus]|uniref:Secreted protein n=1 Tax=Necator americanus TaxID=51031 RepID=A0ABR1BV63_NECAM